MPLETFGKIENIWKGNHWKQKKNESANTSLTDQNKNLVSLNELIRIKLPP